MVAQVDQGSRLQLARPRAAAFARSGGRRLAIVPAREVLANVLLDQGKPADALKEYEAARRCCSREPNRLRATLGAARSAGGLGDKANARAHYRKVLELTKTADIARPELLHAWRVLCRG